MRVARRGTRVATAGLPGAAWKYPKGGAFWCATRRTASWGTSTIRPRHGFPSSRASEPAPSSSISRFVAPLGSLYLGVLLCLVPGATRGRVSVPSDGQLSLARNKGVGTLRGPRWPALDHTAFRVSGTPGSTHPTRGDRIALLCPGNTCREARIPGSATSERCCRDHRRQTKDATAYHAEATATVVDGW